MNWNKENVIKFIESYKEKHVLWDPSHKGYYNRNLKQEAWEELSVEMKCEVEELKKKMEYLLAALRREKGKITKTRTTGKGADKVYLSTWFAFKYMQFLMDRNRPRQRINTEFEDRTSKDYTSVNDQLGEDHEIGEDHDQLQDKQPCSTASNESKDQTTYNNTKNPSKSEFKSPLQKKKKYVAHQDPMLQSAFDLLESSVLAAKAISTSTAAATGLDQYQLYANYLAGKFRGYSKQTYMAVEHQINNLLYNADCGQYEYQRRYSTPESTSYSMADTRPPKMSENSYSNKAQSPAPYTAENQQPINDSPAPKMNSVAPVKGQKSSFYRRAKTSSKKL